MYSYLIIVNVSIKDKCALKTRFKELEREARTPLDDAVDAGCPAFAMLVTLVDAGWNDGGDTPTLVARIAVKELKRAPGGVRAHLRQRRVRQLAREALAPALAAVLLGGSGERVPHVESIWFIVLFLKIQPLETHHAVVGAVAAHKKLRICVYKHSIRTNITPLIGVHKLFTEWHLVARKIGTSKKI